MATTMTACEWAESITQRISGIAKPFGVAVEGGAVESGSWYLRIGFPDQSGERGFTVRISTHRSRKAKGKIKVHPDDVELRLREFETELHRRTQE